MSVRSATLTRKEFTDKVTFFCGCVVVFECVVCLWCFFFVCGVCVCVRCVCFFVYVCGVCLSVWSVCVCGVCVFVVCGVCGVCVCVSLVTTAYRRW